MSPNRLDVLDERLGRVVVQFAESIDGERSTSAASTLVDPYDAILLRVELTAIATGAMRGARAAMEIESRLSIRVARYFPVDFISVR